MFESSQRLSRPLFHTKLGRLIMCSQYRKSSRRVFEMSTMLAWIVVQIACLSITSAIPHQTSSQTISSVTTTINLPAGYIHYPSINAALKVHRERRNWSDAKEACISEGGRLAVIDTHEKLQYVKAIKPKYTDVYVGIIRDSPHWVAADDHSPRANLPWEPNRPDSFGDCTAVNVRGNGLCNKLCIWRRSFVCEILTTTAVHQTPNII